jgi:hypothetical protein
MMNFTWMGARVVALHATLTVGVPPIARA